MLTSGLELLKDIHPNPQKEEGMLRPIQVGDLLYFLRSSEIYGWELWKSDGTPEGSSLVKDIFPLQAWPGSNTSDQVTHLTNVNGTLFFRASDGAHGFELWKSDGTEQGTQLVKDIRPGSGDSISYSVNTSGLTNVNGTLFFAANDEMHGFELWKSDGTEQGTMMVKDIAWGTLGSNPRGLINVSGTLFFQANDGVHGRELWKSDGTPEGTVMVKDIRPGGANSLSNSFSPMENVHGVLYFSAHDGMHGYELWRSDGTPAGTFMVKDIYPGSQSNPERLINVAGTLYFSARDGVHGHELWKSDGTPNGTVMVKDIRPGSGQSYIGQLTNVNGQLYFIANDGTHGAELWKSNGTSSGTVLVKDIRPGSQQSVSRYLTNANGTLYFVANDGTNGTELWKSDGTAIGTVRLTDIYPLNFPENPSNLVAFQDRVYFSARVWISDTNARIDVWATDGTANGTEIKIPAVKEGAFRGGESFDSLGDSYLFSANDGVHGLELWKTDGTSTGTALVKDIKPGSEGSQLHHWNKLEFNGEILLIANDGAHGYELWKSDGTEAGTVLLKDIRPGSASSYPGGFRSGHGKVYFNADDGVHGAELWTTDGTQGGTNLFNDLQPGSSSSWPQPGAFAGGFLYFSANHPSFGRELWKTDGTAAGTVLVKDIRPGANSSFLGSFTEMNGVLYFTADDGTHGEELWRSDGTAAGTVLVKDIQPGGTKSSTKSLTNVNGTLFFTASDGIHGEELWKSDGTAAGTVMVKNIHPSTGQDGAAASPRYLVNINGTLYFSANDGIHGEELWTSDGTPEGTRMVFNLTGDSGGSNPRVIADLGDEKLLVLATTATYGRELYVLNLRGAAPPTVTGLHVRGSGWNQNYLDMLEASGVGSSTGGFRLIDGAGQLANSSLVTWQTINQISASFSQPVVVASEALRLLDSTNSDLPLAVNGFNYDPVSLTASWTLAEPLPVGKYLIVLESPMIVDQHGQSLDGEFIQSQDTFASSGDGSEGGDFYFRFNYLPGDVTRNAQTNQGDANLLRSLGTVLPSSHNYWQDVTGNHQINAGDANYVLSLGTLSLSGFSDPAIPPPARSGRGSTWDAPEEDQGEEENEHRPVTEASVDDGWLASHTPALTPVVIEDVERKACRIEWLPLTDMSSFPDTCPMLLGCSRS